MFIIQTPKSYLEPCSNSCKVSISLWVKIIYHVRCNGVPKSIDLRNTHPRSLWWFPSILWRPQPTSWGHWRTSKSRPFPCKVPSVSHRPWQAGAAGPGRRGGHHSPEEGAPCVPLAFFCRFASAVPSAWFCCCFCPIVWMSRTALLLWMRCWSPFSKIWYFYCKQYMRRFQQGKMEQL